MHLHRLMSGSEHCRFDWDATPCPAGFCRVSCIVEPEVFHVGTLARFAHRFVQGVARDCRTVLPDKDQTCCVQVPDLGALRSRLISARTFFTASVSGASWRTAVFNLPPSGEIVPDSSSMSSQRSRSRSPSDRHVSSPAISNLATTQGFP